VLKDAARDSDRGSTLMLMPAAMLMVIVLAAITMDLSLVHLGRRELVAGAEAAADDAVTYGLDEGLYRAGDGFLLSPSRVEHAVTRSLQARGLLGKLDTPPNITITGNEVSVRLAMRVTYVFAKALPGVAHATTVTATGIARPVQR
jgi:hypothetical protein